MYLVKNFETKEENVFPAFLIEGYDLSIKKNKEMTMVVHSGEFRSVYKKNKPILYIKKLNNPLPQNG